MSVENIVESLRVLGGLRLGAKRAAQQAQGPTLRAIGDEQFAESLDEYLMRIAALYDLHGPEKNNRIHHSQDCDPLVLTLDWIDAGAADMARAEARAETEIAELRASQERIDAKQLLDNETISDYVAQLRGDAKAKAPETADEVRSRVKHEIASDLEKNWANFRRLATVAAANSQARPPVVIEMTRIDYRSASHPRDVDREVARLATVSLQAALLGDDEGQTILQKRAAAFQFVLSGDTLNPSEGESLADCAARRVCEAAATLGVSNDLLIIEWTTAARVRGEPEELAPDMQRYTIRD